LIGSAMSRNNFIDVEFILVKIYLKVKWFMFDYLKNGSSHEFSCFDIWY